MQILINDDLDAILTQNPDILYYYLGYIHIRRRMLNKILTHKHNHHGTLDNREYIHLLVIEMLHIHHNPYHIQLQLLDHWYLMHSDLSTQNYPVILFLENRDLRIVPKMICLLFFLDLYDFLFLRINPILHTSQRTL